jgi:hypothetical protein
MRRSVHTTDRQTCSPSDWRGWFYLSIGLVWFWTGIEGTILQPGLGSVISWMGIAVALVSCLCVMTALFMLRSLPPTDRARRRRVEVIPLLIALVAMVVFIVLALALPRSELHDFYTYSTWILLGALNIFIGSDAFLERPHEQNPGGLYLVLGLAVLAWGSAFSVIPLVGTGFPVLWASTSVVLGASLYLAAVTLVLRYPSEANRGQRTGCGALIASLAYGATGMLMLSFYLCTMILAFMLSFAVTAPQIAQFLRFVAWTLLGAGAIWLGVCQLRGWDWV